MPTSLIEASLLNKKNKTVLVHTDFSGQLALNVNADTTLPTYKAWADILNCIIYT
jgi:hypothetical protein